MTTEMVKVSVLKLVYPPISNQEAVWLQTDPEVEQRLRMSDFYVIGGRAESKFENFNVDYENHTSKFDLCTHDINVSCRLKHLDLQSLSEKKDLESYNIEAGEKLIRLWDGEIGNSNLLDWFTTEKILYDRWNCKLGVEGMDNYRQLTTYDMLYVGIAKKGDSFDRLIKHGHRARTEILANEPQRYPGARITDETFLFMFKVEPLFIQTFEAEHQFTDGDFDQTCSHKSIVADAEKAFVSMLKPHYNIEMFKSYPKSIDGLYKAGLGRYCYVIGENLTFNTSHGFIKGGYNPNTGMISNECDSIFVEGDNVKLVKGECQE